MLRNVKVRYYKEEALTREQVKFSHAREALPLSLTPIRQPPP